MKVKTLGSLILFSSVCFAQEPTEFERKMYNIYKTSYSEEVPDDLWNDYLKSINKRSYTVSPGDTLWGLSQVFFGEGTYWSKIWSYNQNLTNPHMLKVGQNIDFFSGSLEEPPSLSIQNSDKTAEAQNPTNVPKNFVPVVDAADGAPEPEQEQATVAEKPKTFSPKYSSSGPLYPGAPSIPPPFTATTPVLEDLPSTFRNAESFDSSKYDDRGISLDLRPPVRVLPLFVAHSFLYGNDATKYPRIGELLESEEGNLLVGLNQEVYITSKQELKPGEVLTVMGKDYDFDRNGIAGSVIRFMAQVKINDQLPNKTYRGEISHSLSGIRGGAWVTREQIPNFEDDYTGRPANLRLQVIGGGLDNVSRIFGESDVIYLKGGANQGLRVGDILGVYKNRTLRLEEPKVAVSPTPIGHIKVFRAEPNLSSAFVISSREVILPGDETGSPTMFYDNKTTQSEKDDLNQIEGGLDSGPAPEKAQGPSLGDELKDLE